MSYFPSQNVRNQVQMIKYVEISRFQSILKLDIAFVVSLLFLKLFEAVYLVIFTSSNCDKMRALFMFPNIDYT